MRIGTSLVLIAVGLILRYALDVEVPGLDVLALGSILFLVGLLGLGVSVWVEWNAIRGVRRPRAARSGRARPGKAEPAGLPAARRDATPQARPRYDPVVGEVDEAEVDRVLRDAERRR